MVAAEKKAIKVAVLIFKQGDVLDFAGPLEILTHIRHSGFSSMAEAINVFNVKIIGQDKSVQTECSLRINVDMTFAEASQQLSEFDVLVVPGARPDLIEDMIAKNDPIIQFVRDFLAHDRGDGGEERMILTVCTGALLLAAAGGLGGLKATTHHWSLDALRKLEPSADVVSSVDGSHAGRYVDAGKGKNGVRIISAGGVTCGLDASLYVGELKAGKPAADLTSQVLEHNWRRVE